MKESSIKGKKISRGIEHQEFNVMRKEYNFYFSYLNLTSYFEFKCHQKNKFDLNLKFTMS